MLNQCLTRSGSLEKLDRIRTNHRRFSCCRPPRVNIPTELQWVLNLSAKTVAQLVHLAAFRTSFRQLPQEREPIDRLKEVHDHRHELGFASGLLEYPGRPCCTSAPTRVPRPCLGVVPSAAEGRTHLAHPMTHQFMMQSFKSGLFSPNRSTSAHVVKSIARSHFGHVESRNHADCQAELQRSSRGISLKTMFPYPLNFLEPVCLDLHLLNHFRLHAKAVLSQ